MDGINHLFVATETGYLYRLTPPSSPSSSSLELDNKTVQKSILKIGPPALAITVDQRTSGTKKQNVFFIHFIILYSFIVNIIL